MPQNQLVDTPSSIESLPEQLEAETLAIINEETVIGLDALVALMPQYSWSQIFHTIDRLARSGRIVLRRHRFDYTVFSKHYAT